MIQKQKRAMDETRKLLSGTNYIGSATDFNWKNGTSIFYHENAANLAKNDPDHFGKNTKVEVTGFRGWLQDNLGGKWYMIRYYPDYNEKQIRTKEGETIRAIKDSPETCAKENYNLKNKDTPWALHPEKGTPSKHKNHKGWVLYGYIGPDNLTEKVEKEDVSPLKNAAMNLQPRMV